MLLVMLQRKHQWPVQHTYAPPTILIIRQKNYITQAAKVDVMVSCCVVCDP